MKLLEEIERIEEILVQTDPADEKYMQLLGALGQLAYTCGELSRLGLTESDQPKADKPNESVATLAEVPHKQTAQETMTEVIEEQVAQDELTFDKVKAICTEAMSKGIKIKPIMQKYSSVGKLTDVDPKDYAALVEEVRNAG